MGPRRRSVYTFRFHPYDDTDRQYQIYQIFAYDEHFIDAACPTSLIGWLPWQAPYRQDEKIGITGPPEISPTRADAWWAKHWKVLRRNCADDASTNALITLRKILVLDSALRPTAAEVLQDSWFL